MEKNQSTGKAALGYGLAVRIISEVTAIILFPALGWIYFYNRFFSTDQRVGLLIGLAMIAILSFFLIFYRAKKYGEWIS